MESNGGLRNMRTTGVWIRGRHGAPSGLQCAGESGEF